MYPSSSASDITSIFSDSSDRQLKAFIAAAEQHGSDGRGRSGLIGFMMFVAKEHPAKFANWLNKVQGAKQRRPLGSSRRPPPEIKDTIVSDAIIQAAEQFGGDGKGRDGAVGFLAAYARKHSREFINLLNIPLTAECAPGGPVELRQRKHGVMTLDDLVAMVNAREQVNNQAEDQDKDKDGEPSE